MIQNYIKQTWRSLVKNKTYSILNIVGLSAGLTCFAFIALWVSDEVSYDKFNTNYDRIVRVVGSLKTQTGSTEMAVSSAPMAQALKTDYPEVENAVRLDPHEEIIRHKGQQILQPDILVTDPSFFDIFSYRLLKGNQATALLEPYSIILTETSAKKFFGDKDPIGEVLTINMFDSGSNGAAYKVTGIIADPPKNAHFTFTMLASFKTAEVADPGILTVDGWGGSSYYTYLLLKKGVDHRAFSKKITTFYEKYVGAELAAIWKPIYTYYLQPLSAIHLRSRLQYEIAQTGNINHVYIFTTIGIFILLLAGINYVNLATARSVSRAKEVGIKKVVGAFKKQLIAQYLFEAIFTSLLALVASFIFCILLQPLFFQVTGKDLSLSSPGLIVFLAGITMLLGVLSGIYPAIIISGFKPVSVLKGAFKTGTKGVILRRSLVVAQFIITIILVTGVIVITSQMSYIKHKDLGYDKNALLFLRVHGNTDVISGYNAFKNELLSNPLVLGAAISNSMPGSFDSGGSETTDEKGDKVQINTARLRVDADYLNVYNLKLVAGRDFDKASSKDTVRPVIINESAVVKLGWNNNETALGKRFTMGNQRGAVIGVVKDFHFSPLQQAIGPLAIYPLGDRFSRITLKTDVSKPTEVIAWVEKTWKKHFPSSLLDYNFLDNAIGDQYRAEERFSKIFSWFSILSLLIACLGLYGLIAYATSQKTKEIGIRKVLGASANGIATMLSKDFLKLVLLAFVIAAPVAGYIMNNWLSDFAYRTNLSWWMFAAAGASVLLIALFTISFQAIKAAIANPVKSLRTE